MSTVQIERAKSAAPCVLWDGRRTHDIDVSPPAVKTLYVQVNEAADLVGREPENWVVKVGADLVKSELARRAKASAPAEPGGGN
jgi:hypothetical protein